MKREILCIDFTIFVHEYVNFISDKVKEFDYSLRDSNLDLPFDLGLYNNIFNETFFKEAILKDKVVFTYRQEDILSYLQEGDTVYNVDFFSDEEEYNFLVTNKSWASFAEEFYKIDYNWIYTIDSPINSKKALKEVKQTNLNVLYTDCDKVIISLSPELILNKYHDYFYNLKSLCNILTGKEHEIYENFSNRMCYDKAKKEFNKKYCITTLLATDSYLAGVLALNYSLLAHNSDYELVVIVTDSCSKIIFDTLNLYNIKHIKVKDLKPIIPPDQYDYNCTDVGGAIYNKVYAWALTEYERVLFLDADCVVVGDINNIFELNDSCEVCGNISKYKNKQSYAGGLFICSPNKELFNKLVKEVVEIDFMIDPPDAVLLTNNFPLKELKLNNNMIFHYNEKQKYWMGKSHEDVFKQVKEIISLEKYNTWFDLSNDGDLTEISWVYYKQQKNNSKNI